jgi:predicted dehydrogenase
MRQIFQNLGNGVTVVSTVPEPQCGNGVLIVQSSTSLVSSGTERMLVGFGKASLLTKARQQPDKVRMVLDKIRTDGLLPTLEAVRHKLEQPLPMGYCNVGQAVEIGDGVTGFKPGDRVVSNGHHAEFVRVPVNLCARVPESVSDESAAFTVIGAIALQGIRLAQPTLGEHVAVIGLGLIGLMTVQLLRAQGCRVLGIDLDPTKVRLAEQLGAERAIVGSEADVLAEAEQFSRGRGMDAVLITAATSSNEPVSQAAKMCRKRGRIVLVGVAGLELSRADFYEKELSFQVSCSYGPGRYDPEYEDKGHDYPVGFVRWTEQRNLEAVLDMMASGALDVGPLISHRFDFDDALKAYELLSGDEPSLGILLKYGAGEESASQQRTVHLSESISAPNANPADPVVGFIGAGNYAGRVLVPAFREAGAVLDSIVSGGGASGVHIGKKHGIAKASSDVDSVIQDERINTLVVATRHDSHARYVLEGLRAGKHVFVEKPLCLMLEALGEIEAQAMAESNNRGGEKVRSGTDREAGLGHAAPTSNLNPILMVGFNRRFAPHTVKIKQLLERSSGPKSFIMTVNAGAIPADHWTQDPAIGGGRIVGEACHFVDLLRFLAASPIADFDVRYMGGRGPADLRDNAVIALEFDDGSVGAIHYLANGSKAFPKERLEVFGGGAVLQLDNFRRMRGFGWPGFSKMNLMRQDKGQKACVAAFLDAIRNGSQPPIPLGEILEVSRVSIEAARSA